jgi:hypothetical protein
MRGRGRSTTDFVRALLSVPAGAHLALARILQLCDHIAIFGCDAEDDRNTTPIARNLAVDRIVARTGQCFPNKISLRKPQPARR